MAVEQEPGVGNIDRGHGTIIGWSVVAEMHRHLDTGHPQVVLQGQGTEQGGISLSWSGSID